MTVLASSLWWYYVCTPMTRHRKCPRRSSILRCAIFNRVIGVGPFNGVKRATSASVSSTRMSRMFFAASVRASGKSFRSLRYSSRVMGRMTLSPSSLCVCHYRCRCLTAATIHGVPTSRQAISQQIIFSFLVSGAMTVSRSSLCGNRRKDMSSQTPTSPSRQSRIDSRTDTHTDTHTHTHIHILIFFFFYLLSLSISIYYT